MALNPETQYAGKIAPSTAAYPYGQARNITTPGDGRGTPWEAALVNDIFGFQQALLSEAAIVPSGAPDEVGASQYVEAIGIISGRKVASYAAALALNPAKWPAGSKISITNSGVAGDFYVRAGTIADSAVGIRLSDGTWSAAGKYLARAESAEVLASWFLVTTANSATANSAALQSAIDFLITIALVGSNFRDTMATIVLPKGFCAMGSLDLGDVNGTMGLTIRGHGAWASKLVVEAGAQWTGFGSSNLVFNDLAIVSAGGVDDDTELFGVSTTSGGSLRSWRFNRVDFVAFYRVFHVTGSTVCSEFYFNQTRFLECYTLCYNENVQALNWNFTNCDWENSGIVTAKPLADATAFHLEKGLGVKWDGGSFLIKGALAICQFEAGSVVSRFSHKLTFSGVRMEYRSTDSILFKRAGVYVKGSNNLDINIDGGSLDIAGALGPNPQLMETWEGMNLTCENWACEGGYIANDVGAIANSQWAKLRVINCGRLDVVTSQASAPFLYSTDSVEFDPTTAGTTNSTPNKAIVENRPYHDSTNSLCPVFTSKYIHTTGSTGTITAHLGTQVLPVLSALSCVMSLQLRKSRNTANAVTVALEDEAGVAVTWTAAGTLVTVTHVAHNLFDADEVYVSGGSDALVDGVFSITRTGADTYTYVAPGSPAASGTSDERRYYAEVTVAGNTRYGAAALFAQVGVNANAAMRLRITHDSGAEAIKGLLTVEYT